MAYEIDFIPVGDGEKSGDAIAFRFGSLQGRRDEQVVGVIDGGFEDSGKQLVEHIQSYYKTDFVNVAISTHPDADHASGLEIVLTELGVGELWMHQPWNHTDDIAKMFKDGRVSDNRVEEALRKSLDNARSLERIATAKKIPIVEPFTGVSDSTQRIIVVGPTGLFYESLLPDFRCTPEPKTTGLLEKAFRATEEYVKKIAERWDIETLTDDGETTAENNSSVILLVAVDTEKYLLFTGDAGMPALTRAADILKNANIDYSKIPFMQVPHHGSQRNVGPTILNRLVGPKIREDKKLKTAFVSAAKDGAPKHPSKRVTNAFRRRGAHVYATDGSKKWHHSHDAPDRNWSQAVPVPFYPEVEE